MCSGGGLYRKSVVSSCSSMGQWPPQSCDWKLSNLTFSLSDRVEHYVIIVLLDPASQSQVNWVAIYSAWITDVDFGLLLHINIATFFSSTFIKNVYVVFLRLFYSSNRFVTFLSGVIKVLGQCNCVSHCVVKQADTWCGCGVHLPGYVWVGLSPSPRGLRNHLLCSQQ